MDIIHYNKSLKTLAANLRKNSTKSEIILWEQLKGRKIQESKFTRQKPIGNYIVDFYCKELHLGIELDGISHTFEEVMDKDEVKESYLNKIGIKIIRFNDEEVIKDLKNVIKVIEMEIKEIKEIQEKKIPYKNNALSRSPRLSGEA